MKNIKGVNCSIKQNRIIVDIFCPHDHFILNLENLAKILLLNLQKKKFNANYNLESNYQNIKSKKEAETVHNISFA